MPRFFFHLCSRSGELIRDEEGLELPDLATATREAARAVNRLARDAELGGDDYNGWRFEIIETGAHSPSALVEIAKETV